MVFPTTTPAGLLEEQSLNLQLNHDMRLHSCTCHSYVKSEFSSLQLRFFQFTTHFRQLVYFCLFNIMLAVAVVCHKASGTLISCHYRSETLAPKVVYHNAICCPFFLRCQNGIWRNPHSIKSVLASLRYHRDCLQLDSSDDVLKLDLESLVWTLDSK
jgi:hypothetical protein